MKAKDLAKGMTLTIVDEDFGTASGRIVELTRPIVPETGEVYAVEFRLEDGTTGKFYNPDAEVDAK